MEEANESGGTSRVEEEDEEGIAQDNHKGESEMMYDAIQADGKKKGPAFEACLKERADLEAENDILSRRIRDLREEEQYLDQVLNQTIDFENVIQDIKQKNADVSADIEARAASWMVLDDAAGDSGCDCSDDEGPDEEGFEREGEGEGAEKDKNEAHIFDVDPDLSLIRQFDQSLDRSVTTVRTGTLDKLVSCLFQGYGHDIPNYVDTFLLTYRSFITPSKLLEGLINAYPKEGEGEDGGGGGGGGEGGEGGGEGGKGEVQKQARHRARIGNFLKKWASSCGEDFLENDREVLVKFEEWLASDAFKDKEKGMYAFLKKAVDAVDGQNVKKELTKFSQPAPTPIKPKRPNFSLLDLDQGELARQLTVMCSRTYCAIQSWEFLGQSWNKKDKEKSAPHICQLTTRFNSTSRWIETQVVSEGNLRRRANILEFFIGVGEKMNELNNFHGIMEILSGLQSSSVFRLKKTWESVSKRKLASLQKLGSCLSRESSYKVYRETLHSRQPPIIPYIGVYLSDLTFLEDGNKDWTENEHVNFNKRIMISNVIKEIKQYQQMPYNIVDMEEIQKYLEDMSTKSYSENQIYEHSLKCEPRASAPK